MTLDVRIADARRLTKHRASVVLVRLSRQGKRAAEEAVRRALPWLLGVPLEGKIAVISESRVRFRT